MEMVCIIAALFSSISVGCGTAWILISKMSQTGDSVSSGDELQRDYANFSEFHTMRIK